jgi:hypothetical protein
MASYWRQIFRNGTTGKYIVIDELSVRNVVRDGNCLFRSLGILLDDEGRYNRLMQKAVQ